MKVSLFRLVVTIVTLVVSTTSTTVHATNQKSSSDSSSTGSGSKGSDTSGGSSQGPSSRVAVLDRVLRHPVKQDRHPSRLVLQEARHQELIHQVFHLQHQVNNNSNYSLRVLMVRSRIAVVNVLQQALMGLLEDTLKSLAKVSQPVPKMESPVYVIQQRPVQKEEMRLQQDF